MNIPIKLCVCISIWLFLMPNTAHGENIINTQTVNQYAYNSVYQCVYTSAYMDKISIDDSKMVKKIYYDVPLTNEEQNYLIDLCNKSNVDVKLVLAIIRVESDFDKDLISPTKDYGICQINIVHHKSLARLFRTKNFLDYKQNVRCGVYLVWCSLQEGKGNLHKSLTIYNRGLGGYDDYFKKYRTSKSDYSIKVLQEYSNIKLR